MCPRPPHLNHRVPREDLCDLDDEPDWAVEGGGKCLEFAVVADLSVEDEATRAFVKDLGV